MTEEERKKREEIEKQVPKTFMSPAYIEEKEAGVYAMYRDILVETKEADGVGGFYREKMGKRIGPMYIFRPCRKGEEPDYISSKPDGSPLFLWQIMPAKLSLEEQKYKEANPGQ